MAQRGNGHGDVSQRTKLIVNTITGIVVALISAAAIIIAPILSKDNHENPNSSSSSTPSSSSSSSSTQSSSSSSSSTQSSISSSSSTQSSISSSSSTSSSSDTSTNGGNGGEPPLLPQVYKCENGRIELKNSHSGTALIYKQYLDNNPIGLVDNQERKLIGWAVILYKTNERVYLNIELDNNDSLNTKVSYSVNHNNKIQLVATTLCSYTDGGDLQIVFSIDNVPYDLRESFYMSVGRTTM